MTRRCRGNGVITSVTIEGYSTPIEILEHKKIKNWSVVRLELREIGPSLRERAMRLWNEQHRTLEGGDPGTQREEVGENPPENRGNGGNEAENAVRGAEEVNFDFRGFEEMGEDWAESFSWQ
jgi:hypothetical protein